MCISVMNAVRDYSAHKGSRLVLLLMIADSVSEESNTSFCSVGRLARLARLNRSETHAYLNDLIASGELIVTERAGHTNLYAIPILPAEPGYAPLSCTGEGHACNGCHTSLDQTRTVLPAQRRSARNPGAVYADGISRSPAGRTGESGGPKGRTGGVLRAGPNPSLIPYLSQSDPDARARDSSIHENIDEPEREPEPEMPSPPPAPPPPVPTPQPAGPEQRAMWRAVQSHLAERGVSAPQLDVMTTAHLYRLGPGMWRLRVPRGTEASMFRARYEDLIIDALAEETRRSNQVVEFAS